MKKEYIGENENIVGLAQFRDHLLGLGCQPATCAVFYTHVEEFLCYVKKPFSTVERADIEQFYAYLQERPCRNRAGGLSTHYINHYLCALRSFFNWQQHNGRLGAHPMSAMKLLPPEGKPRYPLSQAQIAALFHASENLKESALLHLYYSLGLRRSEGVALNLRDVHFKLCLVYVRSGKGGKRRVVPMPEKVSQALEEYVLKERGYGRAEAFILSKSGHRHTGGWCNKLVKLLMERANQAGAGIEATASLHHLRHSIASHLLESGLSVEQIRDFLGHSRLDTTAVYAHIAHLWLKEEKQKK